MGEAHQLGCPKIVLDHMCIYIYIYIYIIYYVCVHHNALVYIVLEVHELEMH